MRKMLSIVLAVCIIINANAQFSVKDLLLLPEMQPKSLDHFMMKNDFFRTGYTNGSDKNFLQLKKHHKRDTLPAETVNIYSKNNFSYYDFHTYSHEKYVEGWERLIKSGYHHSDAQNNPKDSLTLFEKANVTISAGWETVDTLKQYYFSMKQRPIPDEINYAEDLLQFDTHDYLVSYFGRRNVTDDLYYFSNTELKKCSVLFMGTNRQAAFIWADDNNLDHLSFIVVSNVIPTKLSDKLGIPDATNEWKFKNGLRWGMKIRDILRLNEMDFYVYGNKSDLSFMVVPQITGKLDLKKTGIMLKCDNCYGNELFDQQEVSALDIAKANLPVKIFDIILYP